MSRKCRTCVKCQLKLNGINHQYFIVNSTKTHIKCWNWAIWLFLLTQNISLLWIWCQQHNSKRGEGQIKTRTDNIFFREGLAYFSKTTTLCTYPTAWLCSNVCVCVKLTSLHSRPTLKAFGALWSEKYDKLISKLFICQNPVSSKNEEKTNGFKIKTDGFFSFQTKEQKEEMIQHSGKQW